MILFFVFVAWNIGVVAGQPMDGSAESSSSSAGSHVAGPKRELQKAKKDVEEDESVFKAFTGSANRIDGKQVKVDSNEKKDSKEDIAAKRLAAMSGGGKKDSSSTSGGGSGSPATAPLPARQSRIGDKYSKHKKAVSAFTGSSNKLG